MNAETVEPVSPELLRRYDVAGPRYTSYPTADRFVEAFTANDYVQALQQRRSGAAALVLPLSLYVHIPFCESLCYYCACNKIITKHHDRAAEYLRYLSREVDLHTAQLGLQGRILRLTFQCPSIKAACPMIFFLHLIQQSDLFERQWIVIKG